MESRRFEDVLTQGVRRMAAEARERLEKHPSPDQLVAYEAAELSETEASEVREHLAVCHECSRAVLDLASFPKIEPRPGVELLSSEEEETQWRRVLDRIAQEESEVGTRDGSGASSHKRWRPLQLLAAMLAVASLALGFWVVRLERQRAIEEGPTANVYVAELSPLGASVPRGEQIHRAPAGMRSVLLLLSVADLRTFDDYRLTVRRDGPEGELAWEKDGLVRGPQGGFSINVPRDSLPAGRYRLILEGVSGEASETLAQYDLRIEYEG
jgi:hypothetical protein